MSIRTKIVLIVFLLLAVVGAAFLAYSINTTANYKLLRMDGVMKTVRFASEEVNKTIGAMERNAIDLANAGRTLYLSKSRSDLVGAGIVVDNFTTMPLAVGGGIWFEPEKFIPGRQRACYYALRDKTGSVRLDPDFNSEKYDYVNQMWYVDIARGARGHGVTKWTPPYFDDTGSLALMTTVGAGIFDKEGAFVGMSTVDWEISDVVAKLTAIQPTPGSFVLLAVPHEDYIISNTHNRSNPGAGAPLFKLQWYGKLAQPPHGKVGVSEFEHDGVDYIAFSRFMDNGWLLCVPVPQNEIYSEIERRNRLFSVIIGLASLALLGLAGYLVHILVNQPIRRLISDVQELGRGNLDVKIDVRRRDEIGLLGTAFNKMTVDLRQSIEKSAREHAERERIAGELDVATRIQTSMLPCTFPAFPERDEFDIHATMLPAREVGGDFYDFFMVDEKRLCVVIADVSGKGIPAALFMVIARTLIKNNAQYGKSPADVFQSVNNLLCENNEAVMFVTAFMGYIDLDSGLFTYVNAGHNPPLLCRSGGRFELLPTDPGMVLAIMEGLEYGEDSVVLAPGDTLYLYTDGVTEAEDKAHECFGIDALIASADKRRAGPLAEMLTGVKSDIDAFADGMEQSDDITMLALRMAARAQ